MSIMFENVGLQMYYDDSEEDTDLVVACKDREHMELTGEERWVLNSLTYNEAKQVYEYLCKYFQK